MVMNGGRQPKSMRAGNVTVPTMVPILPIIRNVAIAITLQAILTFRLGCS